MRPLRILLATALLTLPIVVLSRAPWTPPGASDAVLRFAWRMDPGNRENCRPRTAEELAALPVHMRAPEVCTRDEARFRLLLDIDGAPTDTIALARGGVKGDRPVFVLEERRVATGAHSISIRVLREGPEGSSVLAQLDTVLRLEPGDVRLMTLDRDAGRLIVRGGGVER